MIRLVLFAALAVVVPVSGPASAQPAAPDAPKQHGLAMHGDLKYPADFSHFDYVHGEAPKGGRLRLGVAETTFDSFHPFVVKGNPAAGIGSLYDTLMVASADEPFSQYGLLAETAQTPADRSWVLFELRPEARWHDGKPVTPEDVIWTFQTLLEKGQPFYRFYYGNVDRVEQRGERGVYFHFKEATNRELPLILGQLPVLPKHWWAGRTFDAASLEPPLGSGPYRVARFEAGRFVEYERVPDYWGKHLAVNRGRDNFDVQRYEYYRDATIVLEAFKGGQYDFRIENSAKDWATGYDTPDVRAGRIVKEEVPFGLPAGMQGFAMNLRRPVFQDARVREALSYAFDFEWSNQALFYGQYARTRSYFENSELAAKGLPGPEERALLEPFRDRLPEQVFTTEYRPPSTDGSGNNRDNLRRAAELLKAAGWSVEGGKLVKDGRPLAFEVLLPSAQYERVVLPYKANLEKIGVAASVRTVDTAQYRRRMDTFDYDMTLSVFGQSDSPGNEQREFWGSEAAKREGSRNVIGIQDPAVDALVEKIIAAPDRASLVTACRALDRVLQWGHYVVPNWHLAKQRIAYWNRFGMPDEVPKAGVQLDAWWWDAEKAAALDGARP
ncbi:MAG TPA: extracellular solute-binding protein [Myxococcota bacterium]|nr:extracellular solute-binding protein [Myxococcota bacterium]